MNKMESFKHHFSEARQGFIKCKADIERDLNTTLKLAERKISQDGDDLGKLSEISRDIHCYFARLKKLGEKLEKIMVIVANDEKNQSPETVVLDNALDGFVSWSDSKASLLIDLKKATHGWLEFTKGVPFE